MSAVSVSVMLVLMMVGVGGFCIGGALNHLVIMQ